MFAGIQVETWCCIGQHHASYASVVGRVYISLIKKIPRHAESCQVNTLNNFKNQLHRHFNYVRLSLQVEFTNFMKYF